MAAALVNADVKIKWSVDRKIGIFIQPKTECAGVGRIQKMMGTAVFLPQGKLDYSCGLYGYEAPG